jgi:hypothetical protein
MALTAVIALDPNARVLMKRDMEVIRRILLQVQQRTDLAPKPIEIEGVDPIVVGRHVEMLYREGMRDGPRPVQSLRRDSEPPFILVKDLSFAGHDFIAALENDSVWSAIKKRFSAAELAGIPLSVIKDVGMGLLKEWAKSKAGLSGGGGPPMDV